MPRNKDGYDVMMMMMMMMMIHPRIGEYFPAKAEK
jgi:hypothetical protein